MTNKKPCEKKLIRWFLESHDLNPKNHKFIIPPRIIKIFDDETCTFFSSKKASDYIKEFDVLFVEGASGGLVAQRALFKEIAEMQKIIKK